MSMYLGAANDPQVMTVIIWALTRDLVSLEISDRVSLKPVCSATGGGFANNTGADQPAQRHSLISAFVIRVL